jgi:hypothetical protein
MANQTDYRGFEVLAVHPKFYCDDVVELAKPNPKHNPQSNLSDPLIIKRVGAGQVLIDFDKLERELLKVALWRADQRATSNLVPEITPTEVAMREQYEALSHIAPYVRLRTETLRSLQPAFSFS